jgi:CubicO group peptidase (beta-lactamase class C family)
LIVLIVGQIRAGTPARIPALHFEEEVEVIRVVITVLGLASSSDAVPPKPPDDAGMSANRLAVVDRLVRRGIKEGGYPGAAVVVGRKGATVLQRGYGNLSWDLGSAPVSPDQTLYDLASLTKVIATTAAVMALYDDGKLRLDALVVEYLPEFSGGFNDIVTVEQLLTHRSGLPSGRDIWHVSPSASMARAAVLRTPVQGVPGRTYVYSDLGPAILGYLVEAVAQQPLDVYLHNRVFGPLRMHNTFFRPSDTLHYRTAPTAEYSSRGSPLRGIVHDMNAYAMGGVAGHSGLFSTAGDLAIFAQMMLNGGRYQDVQVFSDSTVARFTRRTAGRRALGWDTADGEFGSGRYLSPRAFGHTGFTGTSIWIDPDNDMFMILLTNRVHAARAKRPAKVISDVRADLSDAAVLAVLDNPTGVRQMPKAFRADRAIGWNGDPPRARRSKARSAKSRTARARSAKSKIVRARSKPTSRASSKAKTAARSAAPRKRNSRG